MPCLHDQEIRNQAWTWDTHPPINLTCLRFEFLHLSRQRSHSIAQPASGSLVSCAPNGRVLFSRPCCPTTRRNFKHDVLTASLRVNVFSIEQASADLACTRSRWWESSHRRCWSSWRRSVSRSTASRQSPLSREGERGGVVNVCFKFVVTVSTHWCFFFWPGEALCVGGAHHRCQVAAKLCDAATPYADR